MYRGFKLNFDDNQLFTSDHIGFGTSIYKGYANNFVNKFQQIIDTDKSIDGTGIQKAWFPNVKADIFISHSHKDTQLALQLAGWLKDSLNVNSFVDSVVWQNGDELIKHLSGKMYGKAIDLVTSSQRDIVSGHAHMMLASAITSMMDNCESTFFLNTPSSLKLTDGNTTTRSPWLYYEIGQSQFIRKRVPPRFQVSRERFFALSESIEKAMDLEYQVTLSHFAEINASTLRSWWRRYQQVGGNSMDALYDLFQS
ncbi:MAG: hypothetical protein U0T79_09250 [Ferruginibacter sp.]